MPYSSQELNILEQENLNSHIPVNHNSEQHHFMPHNPWGYRGLQGSAGNAEILQKKVEGSAIK